MTTAKHIIIDLEECPRTVFAGHNKHYELVHTKPDHKPTGDGWELAFGYEDQWTWKREKRNGSV